MNQKILDFYLKGGPDHAGRRLSDIIALTDKELELIHDYIQWLLPTKTGSAFNEDAPLLDAETIAALKANPAFDIIFPMCAQVMLDFWKKNDHWRKKDDHNLLRMTRFMESCTLLGHQKCANELWNYLIGLSKTPQGKFITKSNFEFWRGALQSK